MATQPLPKIYREEIEVPGTAPETVADPLEARLRKLEERLLAEAAALEAMRTANAAATLFAATGQQMLRRPAREALQAAALSTSRQALQDSAPAMLGAGPLGGITGGRQLLGAATGEAIRVLPREALKSAAGEIVKGTGRAAGLGLLIDGAIGSAEALYAYTRGMMDSRQACLHVAKEAATGAVATAAGVGVAAGLVALTGGMAIPAMALVAAAGTLVTKRRLRSLLG